jgi:hypothetical protein
MLKGFRNKGSLFLLAISFLFLNSKIFAATETLESPALRLELSTAPNSYWVIDDQAGSCCCLRAVPGSHLGRRYVSQGGSFPRFDL